ncbi:transporter substrate-binding domain-containing protein [uncultured Methylobacterium sp.]|jgi:cyclohexadienyl dehydratase|uniref:transporter substrate-binding domain-containing protein n=1 Tax=uncultured Methylobacterium sp. TaxID=157278 RepID=UPI00260944FC|nr:transporter substrate-binding domain-containing protein [uncultured Methylobacterium sp.]
MRHASIAALALLALAAPAAARPLAAIKQDGTLRVGLTGDYAPYSLRRDGGTFKGADVTMAEDLAKALGVSLTIVPTTWKTLKDDLVADRYDVAMGGVSVTPDRAAVADFSVPVMTDGKRPVVRCADRERYVSIAAINRPEVRVVFNPGGTNERFARANFPDANQRLHPDNRTIFEEVAENRADVFVSDGAEVDYQSRRHPGVLCPAAVPDSFDHADKAYWMTRDPALKQAVDAWLAPALKSGAYERALAAAAE